MAAESDRTAADARADVGKTQGLSPLTFEPGSEAFAAPPGIGDYSARLDATGDGTVTAAAPARHGMETDTATPAECLPSLPRAELRGTTFDIGEFEHHVRHRRHEQAAQQLASLLTAVGLQLGVTADAGPSNSVREPARAEPEDLWTARVVKAATDLFSDPDFRPSLEGGLQFLFLHRWLSALFSASPAGNADALMWGLTLTRPEDPNRITVPARNLVKFCLLCGPDSRVPLNFDALWQASPPLAAGLALAQLSPYFLGSTEAHQKREMLLPWLAAKLPQIADLDLLPAGLLHSVYMHCSYANRPDKHDIKRSINVVVRRKLEAESLNFLAPPPPPATNAKPVLLVVLEMFSAFHSIYRTASRTLEAARENFHVVALGRTSVDRTGRDVFDEFIELPELPLYAQLRFVRNIARAKDAHVLFMPSVGMNPLTMCLANMRVSPVQVMGLGHPATSRADEIDFVVVEADCVGDPACFSEKLLMLPPDAMPYRPVPVPSSISLPRRSIGRVETLQVAVAASVMKLNPQFLSACAQIAARASRPVHFHFFTGQGMGWMFRQVARFARSHLGEHATVHAYHPYPQFMEKIAGCDLFLDPFPFGNTNGLVDCVTAGLVGICRSGPEVLEHIDGALFGRLGFPSWLVAGDTDDYVAAAVRLIEDDDERLALARDLSGPAVQKLFVGRPGILGQTLLEKLGATLGQASAAPS